MSQSGEAAAPPKLRLTWKACEPIEGRLPTWEAYAATHFLDVEQRGEPDCRDKDGDGTVFPTLQDAQLAAEAGRRASAKSMIEGCRAALGE